MPEVPTLAEAGYPGIGSLNWNGFFVPARTPRPVIDKLYATIVAAMREPEMQDFLAKRLIPVTLSASPRDFDDYVRAEAKKWAKIIKDNNVKID